jgi:DNA polymerase I-like protein with 3'-5' exonuclease and polymerase domains
VDDERSAWGFIREIMADREIKKVFQNGLYDIAFLYRSVGIKVRGAEHDTMLMHHSLQPESLKGLGYLGSIYTDERAWKYMRTSTTIKQEA